MNKGLTRNLYMTTGNDTVDEIGMMHITGNIIPQIWYKTILKETGRPYQLAITILADIVYWYRPTEIRDEITGMVTGWSKKFKKDALQRSYKQYEDMYGESKKTIRAALECLINLGVVNKEIKKTEIINGVTYGNVMYLSLNAEKLKELTYPNVSEKGNISCDIVDPMLDEDIDEINEFNTPSSLLGTRVDSKENTPSTQKGTRVENEENTPSSLLGTRVVTQKVLASTHKGMTNTKTIETSTNNYLSISLSSSDTNDTESDIDNDNITSEKKYLSLEQYLKDKVSYDCFNDYDQTLVEDIITILLTSVYSKSDEDVINLGKKDCPDTKKIALIKNVFEKRLNFGTMKNYVNNFNKHSAQYISDVEKYHICGIYKSCLTTISSARAKYKDLVSVESSI